MFFTHRSVLAGEHQKHTVTILLDNVIILLHSSRLLQDQISNVAKHLAEELNKKQFNHLREFDTFLLQTASKHGPNDIDLVALYIKDDVVFLKTLGRGRIQLNRADKYVLLLSHDNTASGRMQQDDFLIASIEDVKPLWNDLGIDFCNRLHRFFPDQVTRMVPPSAVSLFHHPIIMTRVNEARDISADNTAIGEDEHNSSSHIEDRTFSDAQVRIPLWQRLFQTRALPIAMALIIFGIFIWSVVLGVYRREDQKNNDRIRAVKQSITKKSAEAEDAAFINPTQSLSLISEMDSEFAALKTEMKDKHKEKQLAELETFISKVKKEITKQETKEATEFYDLSLDKKDASGSRFMLVDDELYILDPDLSSVYTLSLSKKSLTSFKQSIINKAELITGDKDMVYVCVPKDGIYRVSEKSVKKVIAGEKNMDDISAIEMYNGNIYILNRGTDVIKYVAMEDGFGGGTSYFKSNTDLTNISSLAIDSSVYLAGGERLLKYSAGLPDVFKTAFPVENVEITKVITNKNVEQVYAWDKKNSSIYILNKNGEYSAQIGSSVLAKASDVTVFDGKVYVLAGSKIYSFAIN